MAEEITIALTSRNMKAWLYKDQSAGTKQRPGILFLPDLTGVGTAIHDSARLLARQGYHVLLPDLYSEMGGVKYCMQMFFNARNRDNYADSPLLAEIHELVDALKTTAGVDAERIGMIGQCLTGGFALHMALRSDVSAPVVFHHSFGRSGTGLPEEYTSRICQNIQGHYVRVDPFCPPDKVARLAAQFAGRLEVNTYHDLPHGIPHFFQMTESGRLAWANMLTFLEATLKEGKRPAPGSI